MKMVWVAKHPNNLHRHRRRNPATARRVSHRNQTRSVPTNLPAHPALPTLRRVLAWSGQLHHFRLRAASTSQPGARVPVRGNSSHLHDSFRSSGNRSTNPPAGDVRDCSSHLPASSPRRSCATLRSARRWPGGRVRAHAICLPAAKNWDASGRKVLVRRPMNAGRRGHGQAGPDRTARLKTKEPK